jgi:hypothetical protein
MIHYVDAAKEKEGTVSLDTMTAGQISIGVRLNQVNWFRGAIKEIRFHSAALKRSALQCR